LKHQSTTDRRFVDLRRPKLSDAGTLLGAAGRPKFDWTEKSSIMDTFPSVLRTQIQQRSSVLATPELGQVPTEIRNTSDGLGDHSLIDLNSYDAHLAHEEGSPLRVEAQRGFTNAQCPVCGHVRTGTDSRWPLPRWQADPAWVVCRRCYSVTRTEHDALPDSQQGGWVIPYDFIERKVMSFRRSGRGVFVDCSPFSLLKDSCASLFEKSLTIEELSGMPGIKANDITCYSCIETVFDIDWVIQLLLKHLTEDGVLRVNLLLSPFQSSPRNSAPWIASKWIRIHQFPSQRGMSALCERLSLKIARRMKTVNLPLSGVSASEYLVGPITAWKAAQACRLLFQSVTNCGFGEELVLCRKDATPSEELMHYPPRPFREVT
jgi:hypothetical protein